MDPGPPLPDTLRDALGERYAVERPLGSGGMAEVFAARDLRHERMVAIKVVRQDGVTPHLDERFVREVRIAARLQHPHIVPLYDSGVAAGYRYYVMPLIDGPTLRQRLGEAKRLPVEEVLRIAEEVAGALDYAHAQDIVHRDIKPENILLSGGHALVVDFGIARPAPKTDGFSTMTRTGLALGTPSYMSPEQAAGERIVDGRSDQYALGCLVYELLTGRPPFVAASAQAVIGKHFREPPPPLGLEPTSPLDALDGVIARALAKDPTERFATSGEFASALRAASARPQESGLAPARVDTSRRITRALVATIIALALLLTAYSVVSRDRLTGPGTAPPAAAKSIAVLPFADLSPTRDNEYFANGMTEELINALAKVEGLRVPARTSSFAFKGRDLDVRTIGDSLNVSTVLEGSVRRSANRLRVSAQLIDVKTGYQLWSDTFERGMKDVFAVQDEIARAIAGALQIKLAGSASSPIVRPSTSSVEAYTLYLKGRHHWNRRTEEDLQKAIGYFNQAIAEDSSFAPAYAVLADCYALLPLLGRTHPARALPLGKQAALTAIALDTTIAEAHIVVAQIMRFDRDRAGAERAFRRAIAVEPTNATARFRYALFLGEARRWREAIAEVERALELEPLSLIIGAGAGAILYWRGEYDQAVAQLRKTIDLDPNFSFAHARLGHGYSQLARHEEAIAELRRAAVLSGDQPVMVAYLAQGLAAAGRPAEARLLVRELEALSTRAYVSPFQVAAVYVALDDRDRAFELLERAFQERDPWMTEVAVDPRFAPLRADHRFVRLLNRMGVAQ